MKEHIQKKIVDRYLEAANPATESAKLRLKRMLDQVPCRYLVQPLVKEDLERGVGLGILTERYQLTPDQVKYIGSKVGYYPKKREG